MGGAQLAEWKRPIQYRLQPASKHVAENFVQLTHRPHVRSEQSQLARKQMAQVEAHGGSGRRAAGHKLAAGLEGSDALVPGSRADVLDHDVFSLFVRDLADFFGNLLLVVMDAVV